ncbi:hypothetical protein NEAUS04_2057 [Nematocida ausubeli]|uniref:Uncharacterized protein n=1 Tax=Nematocida ausubeli (strain ATCC PRA-371 / ERTm2) TaxID=1913371 RepID=A0A086J3Z7_NEMA1|nr:uncharacterized protein NESG_01021 [Nematocida ausubeli]KAI5160318.1 hypothetical protein NEAUS03_1072 [Nematocida ausubeli]KAI5164248.1 hypothetical protein NEAUS04_2057 [Nematocida ausubeli]KFG26865.1 hypothetical protein NESG_01021 [Nematocida ausubeli]
MWIIILMLLGYALCIEEESIKLASIHADTVAVISLFMILGLTFSVSLYGIKKLIEKSPKHMTSRSHLSQSFIPRKQTTEYEVISF